MATNNKIADFKIADFGARNCWLRSIDQNTEDPEDCLVDVERIGFMNVSSTRLCPDDIDKNNRKGYRSRRSVSKSNISRTSNPAPTAADRWRKQNRRALKYRGCILYSNNTVRCGQQVYQNVKIWNLRKYYIDRRIRRLRNHVQGLKNIRRHLKKQGRPVPPTIQLMADFVSAAIRKASLVNSSKILNGTDPGSKVPDASIVDLKSRQCACGPAIRARLDKARKSSMKHPLRKTRFKRSSHNYRFGLDHDNRTWKVHKRYQENQRRRALARATKKAAKADKRSRRRQKKRQKRLYCNIPDLHCFTHDNYHWKTRPFWSLGPFCFCQNAQNNSYACLRTVNETHNFLYCEFITGFISYYDLNADYYQLRNIAGEIALPILQQLSKQLESLRHCHGRMPDNASGGLGLGMAEERADDAKNKRMSYCNVP